MTVIKVRHYGVKLHYINAKILREFLHKPAAPDAILTQIKLLNHYIGHIPKKQNVCTLPATS